MLLGARRVPLSPDGADQSHVDALVACVQLYLHREVTRLTRRGRTRRAGRFTHYRCAAG